MDTKLTLKLDRDIIEKAKAYAASHKRSLSRMIEAYLRYVVDQNATEKVDDLNISPFVKSIKSGKRIPADFDYKKELTRRLSEKHK